MAGLLRRAFRHPAWLAPVSAAAVVGPACLRPAGCSEPEEEPGPRSAGFDMRPPSAPPPPSAPKREASVKDAVVSYFRSPAGQAFLEEMVKRELGQSLRAEIQRAKVEIRSARDVEESQFIGFAKKTAEEAAQAAARTEVERLHSLIEAVASGIVKKECEKAVPKAVREDPLMKRLLQENLDRVHKEVRAAADKELAEICNEDKYHRVNEAFLRALEGRCQQSVRATQENSQKVIAETRGTVRFTQALAFLALLASGAAVFLPRPKL